MFKITLSPQFSSEELTIKKLDNTLFINEVELDFSDMPEGGEYPPEAIEHPFVIGGASKVDGIVSLTVRMPYSNPEPPHSVAFPEPILVTDDGLVELPEGRFADGDQ